MKLVRLHQVPQYYVGSAYTLRDKANLFPNTVYVKRSLSWTPGHVLFWVGGLFLHTGSDMSDKVNENIKSNVMTASRTAHYVKNEHVT